LNDQFEASPLNSFWIKLPQELRYPGNLEGNNI
jgi:hypothetical protein